MVSYLQNGMSVCGGGCRAMSVGAQCWFWRDITAGQAGTGEVERAGVGGVVGWQDDSEEVRKEEAAESFRRFRERVDGGSFVEEISGTDNSVKEESVSEFGVCVLGLEEGCCTGSQLPGERFAECEVAVEVERSIGVEEMVEEAEVKVVELERDW